MVCVCVCVCVLAPGDLRRWKVACRELEVPLPLFRSRARNYQEKSERSAIHAVRFPLFSPYISENNNKQIYRRNLFKIVDFSSISRCFYRFESLKNMLRHQLV